MAEYSRMVQGGMLKKNIQGGRMGEVLDIQKTKAVRRRKWVLNTKKEGKSFCKCWDEVMIARSSVCGDLRTSTIV